MTTVSFLQLVLSSLLLFIVVYLVSFVASKHWPNMFDNRKGWNRSKLNCHWPLTSITWKQVSANQIPYKESDMNGPENVLWWTDRQRWPNWLDWTRVDQSWLINYLLVWSFELTESKALESRIISLKGVQTETIINKNESYLMHIKLFLW